MPYPQNPRKRGEIYWVDYNPARGSEQAGRRPAVIISQDSFNRRMPVVCTAALTTKVKPFTGIAPVLPANDPLRLEGQILAFQVTTIDKTRLDGYMGCLSIKQIDELKRALRMVWDL